MKLTIHFDGGSRGNPGPASVGVVIVESETKKPLLQAGYFLGKCTNNVAEYQGLIHSLKQAQALGGTALDIHSDSQLLVRQITGEYRVKSPALKPLHEEATGLLKKFGRWKIQHVRREHNQQADELANLAMDHQADVNGDRPADPSHPPSAIRHPPSSPCWSAKLTGRNGKCLAGCGTQNEYTFGPTTPDGFCLHATEAMLNSNPMRWAPNMKSGKIRCHTCNTWIQITIIHRG